MQIIETQRINEAVKNNSEKFPSGYLLEITNHEKIELVESFDRFKKIKHSSVTLKGFTENLEEERAARLKQETLFRWQEAEKGKVVSHQAVTQWLDSWGKNKERKRPTDGS